MDTSWFDSNLFLAVATSALVIVTIYYAKQTQKLVRVPYRPSLRPKLATTTQQPNGGYNIYVKIENIGPGIATDIEVKYSIKIDSTAGDTQIGTIEEPLYPLEKSNGTSKRNELPIYKNGLHLYNIGLHPITNETDNYYSEHKVKIKLNLKCKDSFKKKHSFDEDLDVSAYVIPS